ncbi:MAG: T9SS type A sorting domain-containing protein [Flavobacteriales bacterium]
MGVLRESGVSSRFIELSDSGQLISLVENNLVNTTHDLVWSQNYSQFIGVGAGVSEDGFLSGRIFKMNTEGSVIWDTVIGEGYDISFQNQFYKVVKSNDGSGYVAGGTKKVFHPEEEQNDEIGLHLSQGWLVKVDEDGNVLWDRTYHYIDTPFEEHTLNDLKATTDGGYIFCGESRDYDSDLEFSEGPPQQGWLVKVDEHGCLVEGCHLTDNISVLEQDGELEYFKAGPIPAGQFLNIYQSATAHLSIYQLINSNGQVLEEFPSMSKGTTLMLDVSNYASGSYQLVLKRGNKIFQSKKILIE